MGQFVEILWQSLPTHCPSSQEPICHFPNLKVDWSWWAEQWIEFIGENLPYPSICSFSAYKYWAAPSLSICCSSVHHVQFTISRLFVGFCSCPPALALRRYCLLVVFLALCNLSLSMSIPPSVAFQSCSGLSFFFQCWLLLHQASVIYVSRDIWLLVLSLGLDYVSWEKTSKSKLFLFIFLYVCTYLYIHVCVRSYVEANGRYQVSSSVSVHLIFLKQSPLLKLELDKAMVVLWFELECPP